MLGEKSLGELKCLKGELKAWESMFERKHGRRPNKDDVNNASEEIRETYLKYNQLKRDASDVKKTSSRPVDEEQLEDDVFGKSLNKSNTPVTAKRSVRIKISPTEYKPIKLCHGGQRQKKPSANKLKTDFMESTSEDVKQNENGHQPSEVRNDCGTSNDLGFTISSAKKEVSNKPRMMMGKSALAKRMKRRSALASDWLEKNKSELAENISNVIIDPILNGNDRGNFNDSRGCLDGDVDNAHGQGDETETLPFSSDEKGNTKDVRSTSGLGGFKGKSTVDHESVKDCTLKGSHANGRVSSKQASENKEYSSSDSVPTHDINENNINSPLKTKNPIPSQSTGYETHEPTVKHSSDNNSEFLAKRENIGARNAKNNSNTKRKRARAVETSSTSQDVDPSFEDDAEEQPAKKMKTSGGACQEEDVEQVENGKMYEANEDELSQSEINNKGNYSKKRSSGLVSENFRALNMKVRRFSRRGHGTNYAAYKRKMWKQKQQANEQADGKKDQWKKRKGNSAGGNRRISGSTATTTCFKCGEDGHWAKDCPRNKQRAARVPAENWSEPVQAPADLEIPDEQWQAAEEKLQSLVSERQPRAQSTLSQASPPIEPLYEPENDRPINTPQEVYDALNKLGFDSFRCGQEEAIMQILSGLSTLVVLSTGAGKSLCYQLPAYMYSRRSACLTLVISPLVSLMEDQVVGLPFGLHGISLNTNMTKQQRQKAVEKISSGKVAVVLVSPEALVGGSSGAGCLPHPSKLPPIAFACIDEAHCVSEWSHNFRPSYLRVCKVLRERFGVRCFLGLTATATRSTALSVCEHLGIIHRPEAIVRGATIPDNLHLSVSCDMNRDRAILELLQGSRFSNCDSIIIYCTRREQTERLATYLRTCLQKNPFNTSSCITEQNEADETDKENKEKKRGKKGRKSETAKAKRGKNPANSWQAECYHAGLSAAQRKKVQTKFMGGELRIVVATVAFGMGLDKADVRAVIHYNMPKSFESYVQEIGRAGRDGLPSHCHVFIDPEGKDVRELRRHAYASTVDRSTVKKLVHQIFPTCDCKLLHENMNKKRATELNAVSTATASNGSAEQNWFDDDDDLIGQMVKLEAQSSKELRVNDEANISGSGQSEISSETVVHHSQPENQSKDFRHDDINKSDATSNNDVTMDEVPSHDDVTAGRDVMVGDDVVVANGNDVIRNVESGVVDGQAENSGTSRVCGGHEVAIPIDKAVQQLDIKEEAIETLLCYLELHAKRWVQMLKSIRSTCILKFYGGPAHLHYVAQRVPIVTAAVAYARKRGEFKRNTSSLTFPIVQIVDEMGWDLEPVRRELYGLQWNEGLRLAGETGLSTGHSGIIVEFADLAFHVRAPGDLSGDDKDEVCDFLEDRIMAQERSQVAQLHNVWFTFNTKAHPNCWESAEECDKKVDEDLKSIIKAYFSSENDATKSEYETLSTARRNSEFIQSVIPVEEPVNWERISKDIRSFITSHNDLELSGRTIARVFHGIDSPCFPAKVWGRERSYWRRHLDVDFNLLRKVATKELVKFR